ncbi:acetolactate synthase [Aliidongia dinghuensis]|uniref:Acetolactate synthase n=1 Tax=Aliidongia dinghuensis TaxID=1867774 RepID=A0A8J2YSL9_9PROT|nr:thiamine pyrophosphate-binding protein [Aliidongia dinghuensis]GGF13150.1 acetolactate synthase [Aliidongia dinghuensis]
MTAHETAPATAAKVADQIAATLKAYGGAFAVGIPGNDVLETIRACEDQGIRFVLAKSEPSAAFIADAIWQVTERPVALIPALGPGLANAISGLAGALMERSALLVLTGEVAKPQADIYTHQVFDHVALAKPVVKYAADLNGQRAAQQTAKALDVALAYPAGPAMLNIPADVNRQAAKPAVIPQPPKRPRIALTADEAARLNKLIDEAARPLVLIGRGALRQGVPEALEAFVDARQLPFFATYKAKGVVSDKHPLSLGAVGLSPIVDAVNLKQVDAADLLVLVGFDPIELRDAWLDAWGVERRVISLDWGSLDHRVFPMGEEAFGDLPTVLGQLTPATATRRATGHVAAHRAEVAAIVRPRDPVGAISPAGLFKAVSDRVRPDWLMTVDVGAHRILASHAVDCVTPGQMLQSNGLCCMGYAVPAAIGAQLARPDKTVVALVGDGCMLMSLGDLALAAELDLPLVVVVLNDDALSLIKLKQAKMQMAPQAVDFRSPRFADIARGMGGEGVRVDNLADFEAALDAAVARRRFTVIDAVVDPAEYLEQM